MVALSGCAGPVLVRQHHLYVGAFRTSSQTFAHGAKYESISGVGLSLGPKRTGFGYLRDERVTIPDAVTPQTISCPIGTIVVSPTPDAVNQTISTHSSPP